MSSKTRRQLITVKATSYFTVKDVSELVLRWFVKTLAAEFGLCSDLTGGSDTGFALDQHG